MGDLAHILRKSRWFKKQLLNQSDRHVRASLKAMGHRIKASLEHFPITASAPDVTGATTVKIASQAIPLAGFRSLGGGLFKLGHAVWQMENDGEDVVLARKPDAVEPMECAAFAPRKASNVYRAGDVIDIAGLPATVRHLHGPQHLAVEFLGSGIRDIQRIADIESDANSVGQHFYDCLSARMATGAFNRRAFDAELAIVVTECHPDILAGMREIFTASLGNGLRQATQDWLPWNGVWLRAYSPEMFGEVTPHETGAKWAISEMGIESLAGEAPDEETAKDAADHEALEYGLMPKADLTSHIGRQILVPIADGSEYHIAGEIIGVVPAFADREAAFDVLANSGGVLRICAKEALAKEIK